MSDDIADTWMKYEKACAKMQTALVENAWMETIDAAAQELLASIKECYKAEDWR
jgi:hypothetical protein